MASNNHRCVDIFISQNIDVCQEKLLYLVYTRSYRQNPKRSKQSKSVKIGEPVDDIPRNDAICSLNRIFCAYDESLTGFEEMTGILDKENS
jgi:hypothetical protein